MSASIGTFRERSLDPTALQGISAFATTQLFRADNTLISTECCGLAGARQIPAEAKVAKIRAVVDRISNLDVERRGCATENEEGLSRSSTPSLPYRRCDSRERSNRLLGVPEQFELTMRTPPTKRTSIH